MDNENLLVKINELIHNTKVSDENDLSNIIAGVELLKGQYVDFKAIFDKNMRKFEHFKNSGKYKQNIKIICDYMKYLHSTLSIPMKFESVIAEDFDYYFDIYWIYKKIREDSKKLLEDNTRIKSVFNFYYSILNYAELVTERTEETWNKNRDFNFALAEIDENMMLADFYLYDKYKKFNFDTSMPFLKKVFSIILLNTLNQCKNELTRNRYIKPCKVDYVKLTDTFIFGGNNIKITKGERKIIGFLNCNQVLVKDKKDKVTVAISRLNKKIFKATGYAEFIKFDNGYKLNQTDFDITKFNYEYTPISK